MRIILMRLLALAAVGAAFGWMIRSAPSGYHAVLREYNVFVPLTLALGAAGLWRAIQDARRYGWHRDAEGVAVLSLLALAWGHDAGRAAVRRAAPNLLWDSSDYRLVAGALIVAAALLVLRWATRHEAARAWRWPQVLPRTIAGEMPWALFGIIWMLFIAWQNHAIIRLIQSLS